MTESPSWPEPIPTPEPAPRRLHRAAIVVYSAEALGQAALPLVVILAMSVFRGGLDVGDLVRTLAYGVGGLAISVLAGYWRWESTRYWITDRGIRHKTGVLRVQDTNVPFERVQAIDVSQGVLQRWFGVFAVDVQTGAGGKGGEISLPALVQGAVEELRDLRPSPSLPTGGAGVQRRLSAGALAVAAFTAGQLGIVLSVLAVLGQAATQVLEEEGGRDALGLIPDDAAGVALAGVVLLVAAWALSALGAFVAFAGFAVTREDDRLRIRRGLFSRREQTVPVRRVRAVRVVEGVFRRPFGLCSLTVEVTGYAEEAAAARTLFPLVRVREVPAFLAELLPEFEDGLELERPPARAARRYLLLPVLGGLAVAGGAFSVAGPWSVLAAALGAAYGWARWRAAGWHLADGRLAVRTLRIARTTVLAPARLRESHAVAQNVFQRRAELADLSVAFGKRTTARIRHLEAERAFQAWAALAK